MRQILWRSTTLIGGLLLAINASAARGESEPAPAARKPQGPGQLIVTDPQTGTAVRLPIARYRARVVLQPPEAVVQIEQSFENPYGPLEEGTFAINLPVGASVSRFATQAGNGPLREAELADRRPTWGAESTGDDRQNEASLLEEVGPYLFRIRVPEVAGKGTQQIWFDYTAPLVADDGRYRFELPLQSDLKPIAQFEVTGVVQPPMEAESVRCTGLADVKVQRGPQGSSQFEWRGTDVEPPPVLTVEYREPAERGASVRTYTAREKDGVGRPWQYFVVAIPADEAGADKIDAGPIDVQIVADTSGSMQNFKLLTQTVRRIVAALRPEDRFQLGCVDAEFHDVTQGWTTSGSPEADEALARLDHELPLGTSNLWVSLADARSALERSKTDRRRVVLYVGDGVSTDLPEGGVRRSAGGVSFTAVQLGEDGRGSRFLRSVVEAGDGRLFHVKRDPRELQEALRWVRGGMPEPKSIENLQMSAGEDLEWFTPVSWPVGGDLVICGRCRPTDAMNVSLTVRGEAHARVYPLAVPPDNGGDFFTGRLWAQRQLVELGSGKDEVSEQERTEIVQLGQEWSLVTPFSAFLVPGDGLEFSRWLAGRGLRRRYWEMTPSPSVVGSTRQGEVRIDRRPRLGLSHEAQAALAEQDFLETLAGRRGLLDRSVIRSLPATDPLLRSLALGGMSPEYLKHHFCAPQLLRRLSLPEEAMTLAEFAKLLARETGLSVVLDEATLSDAGLAPDQEVAVPAVEGMAARSLLKVVLQDVGGVELDYMLDEHLLQITTRDRADETLHNLVYPVVDLVRTDVLSEPSRLADPFREAERAVHRRLKARLRDPITVHFDGTSLKEVAKQFTSHLGVTVLLDENALSDAGIGEDQEVSLSLEHAPAAQVLDVLLQNVGGVELDYIYENEVLLLTTKDKCDEALTIHIYPLTGVVYDVPPGVMLELPKEPWRVGLAADEKPVIPGRGVSDPGFSAIGPRRMEGEGFGEHADGVADYPSLWRRSGGRAWPAGTAPGFAGHLEEVIELIEDQTEGPWQDIDGIGGSMDVFIPSLSLIVRQTQRVHREIEELLNQLHELRPASALVRPARVPRITADDPAGWDCSSVIELVQNMTEGPWLDLDGIGGTMNSQTPTMSLFVRQTRRVHEEIYELLSDLRRSRYVAEQGFANDGIRPVEEYPLFDEGTRVTDLPAARRRDSLPPPGDDELQLLAACRREPAGRSEWRRTGVDGEREGLMITATDSRLQFKLAQRIFRADGDRGAAVYPGLTLVELGPWGEAVRELADARLPWLPHRSNADLARLYHVRSESSNEERATLRLTFPDLNDAYFLASYRREYGLPIEWEVHLHGKLRYRLRFEYGAAEASNDVCRVALEDPSGAVRERWELVTADASVVVPELTAGCEGYVVDREDDPQGVFRRARTAISQYQYEEAGRLLREELETQPDQPLLNLLLAWMIEFSHERETSRLTQESALRTVARSGAADLVRLIATHNFPGFDDQQLYSLLLEQPPERRSTGNWDRLAELAGTLDRQDERLQHTEHALEQMPKGHAAERRARQLQRIDALLRLQRTEEAVQDAADLLAAAGENGTALSADVADVFYAADNFERGDGYMARALAQPDLSTRDREALLLRQSHWRKGVARWRLLLQAAELSGEDHRQRGSLIARIVDEMTEPGDVLAAGLMAEEAHDPEVKILFKLHEAELTLDHQAAAAIALALQEAGRVPEDRFEWLVDTLVQGMRYEEAARLLEDRARAGHPLDYLLREKMVEAYKALGWKREVRRAESDAQEEHSRSAPRQRAPSFNLGGFGGGGFGGGGFF